MNLSQQIKIGKKGNVLQIHAWQKEWLIFGTFWEKNGWDVVEFVLKNNFENELKQGNKIFLYQCKDDTIVPFKHLNFYKKSFPDATVRVLNGKDHAFANGLPELVNDIKISNGI